MPVAPLGRSDGDLIPASVRAGMARDKLLGRIAYGWAYSAAGLVILLINISGQVAIFRRMFATPPVVAGFTGMGSLCVAIGVVIAAGMGLALSRFQPKLFFAVMSVATVGVLCLCFMGMRDGWAISHSTVVARPAEFWKPDEVFRASDITALRRGCNVSEGRGEIDYQLIFDADYSAAGHGGNWSLNHDFTPRNTTPAIAAQFVDGLSAMRPRAGVPNANIGSSIFDDRTRSPAELRANGNFQQCIDFFTRLLDPQRAASLREIVGAP